MSEERHCVTCKYASVPMWKEPCNTCFANWEVHDALYLYDVDRVCRTCRHQKANAINAPCGTCVSTNWEPKITSEGLTEIHEETERKRGSCLLRSLPNLSKRPRKCGKCGND